MTKYFYFIFISLTVITNLFSQEINIPTEFSQNGKLYKNWNDTSVVLASFEANDECFVIGYSGKDMYKIKYKDWVGFVDSQYLVFNDEIDDIFYAYQDRERLKTIKQEELRRQKIKEIVNNGTENNNEFAKQDSIAKVIAEEKQKALKQEVLTREKEAELFERIKQDSIAKVIAEEKRIALEQEAQARKLEEERLAREKQELIAKFLEEKKQKALEEEVQARKLEDERLAREKQELIAKFLEEKKQKAIEEEAQARKQESERIKQDSIAKVIAEEKRIALEQEVLARKLEEERLAREKQELIAKFLEEKKQKAIEEEAQARKLETERLERIKLDSIAKVRESEREIIEDKVTTASTIENERKEQARLEKIKVRNTCHYAMNEFDAIDKIKIIRTDPYKLTKNLTVELFKRGRSTNVFFNLMEDLGCSSYLPNNRSYVKVKLENNQIITFYHSWDMDCGDFRFKGVISKSQMAILRNSPIKSIFLKGTKYSSEITNIEYKEFFIDKLKCID